MGKVRYTMNHRNYVPVQGVDKERSGNRRKMMKIRYLILPLICIASIKTNIGEFVFATEANRIGTCCTVAYLLAWIAFLVWDPSRTFKQVMFGYWMITGILAGLQWIGTFFQGDPLGLSGLSAGFIILITPLYGVSVKGMAPRVTMGVILLISIVLCVFCLVRLRRRGNK